MPDGGLIQLRQQKSSKGKPAEVFHHSILTAAGTENITAVTFLGLPSALATSFILTAGLAHSASGAELVKGRKAMTRHGIDTSRWGKSKKMLEEA